MPSHFHRFLFSHAGSAFATGVHLVVLAWLAVAELNLSSASWGWLQAAGLLPNLLFMLVAGATADRIDPAKVLATAQAVLSLSYGVLTLALYFNMVSYPLLLSYAILVGAGHAFLQPAREKLVALVETNSLQQRISMLSIVQFSLQGLGMLMLALSDLLPLVAVLSLQSLVSLGACFTFLSIRNIPSAAPPELRKNTLSDIVESLHFIKSTPGLRQLMVLVAFNGYMHMGVFLVLVPVVATKVYHHSPAEYASLQLLFLVGMIVAHIALFRQRFIEFPGQGALFSLLYTALVGFGLAKGPTPIGFYALIFFWGVVAGNSAGRCRLVLQSLAKPELKGRVMAAYQLCLFGAAPIGAIVTGYVMTLLAVSDIFLFMSVSSIVLFVIFMTTRTIWGLKQEPSSLEP